MRALILLTLLTTGCATPSATAPSATAPALLHDMDYDINVPDPLVAAALRSDYPDGVDVPPLDAQRRWNYTAAYLGSPNVYFGPTAPSCYEYIRAGIVVAPQAVAAVETFTARDWPGIGLDPTVTYRWVGRFTYTLVADPLTYIIDPTAPCVPR